MLGIDRPPEATTSDSACTSPRAVCTLKPSGVLSTRCTAQFASTVTPAAAHSSSSMRTICFEESSQNNWPSSFSCQAMRCFSTSAMKSHGVQRASADLAKCGLAER